MSSPCTNNSSCKNVETVETEQKTFKLITLNVLAQCHYDWQHKHKYGYINISENDEMRDFQFRFDRICDYLTNFDADIYTLQEVEIEAFNKNYKPFFDSIGYDGVFQETKNSYHVATATFWRRNLLRLEWSEFRSRSMILCLIPISNVSKDESDTVAVDCGKPLYLINVHLEGNKPDKYTGATRLNQIASTFKKLSSKLKESGEAFENIALIFVGDMNAMPEEETHQLLQNGTLPADFTVSLPGDVFCKPEEPLNIVVTKKQIDLPGKLRNVFADAQPQFTFVGNSHAFVLDAVYVTQHVRVLERIDPSQRVDDVSQFYGRLPCLDLVPSDHLPLGITFQLHTNTNTTC